MLRWAPNDSVSPGDPKRVVGCASRISHKGVIVSLSAVLGYIFSLVDNSEVEC